MHHELPQTQMLSSVCEFATVVDQEEHGVTSHGMAEGSGSCVLEEVMVGCGWGIGFAVGQDLALIQQTLTQDLWKHHRPGQ